jgi:hypothetical protein
MNKIIRDHLLHFERTVAERLQVSPGGRLTGSFGGIYGDVVEEVFGQCLNQLLPRRVELLTQQMVFDSNNRHTKQRVDFVVVVSYGMRTTIDGLPFVPVDSVRAAIEVKRSFNPRNLSSALDQLVSIKKLDRYKLAGRITNRASPHGLTPPPRGNVFCGVLFMLGRPRNADWAEFVRNLITEWNHRWSGQQCDSGRYPNFIWFWNEAFLLKRYSQGDWPIYDHPSFKPDLVVGEFLAPSPRRGSKTERFSYWAWTTPTTADRLSPLGLAAHRLVLQSNEFVSENVDWSRYFVDG